MEICLITLFMTKVRSILLMAFKRFMRKELIRIGSKEWKGQEGIEEYHGGGDKLH